MNAMNLWLLGLGLLAALGGCVVLARAVSTVRRWRSEVMAAIEQTQRQLTELRTAQDLLAARVEESRARLADEIEPRLTAVQRYLQVEETVGEVERGRQAGTLGEETAQRLLAELERLAEKSLAGDSPH